MQATSEANLQRPEPELLRLLGHRYGDGLVYLQDRAEQPVYETAVRRGLIDMDGYLTPAGHAWIARHSTD